MKRNAIVKSVMALMFLLGVFSKGYAQGPKLSMDR